MYGTKLMANSAKKLSRKKYKYVITNAIIRSNAIIHSFSWINRILILDFYIFFAI
jgi:hypothetical protein